MLKQAYNKIIKSQLSAGRQGNHYRKYKRRNCDLLIRHPNAWEVISSLPAWHGQCFRAEVELLLQIYFSLKTENSCQFIANVKTYSKARSIEQLLVKFL